MKCCSLFSGIGGFDLAAEWLGWDIIVQCEIDPFCQRVLKHHFPKAILYEDIKKTDFTKHRGDIDIVFGGFPCQPFSTAGKRRGTNDDHHLWPEMLRVIREVSPHYIVAENVSGLISQQQGMVFESVLTDLENEGYEVQPFIIPACAVGAPHRRDRVWIIAVDSFHKEAASNSKSTGQQARTEGQRKIQSWGRNERTVLSNYWSNFSTQSPFCDRNDGLSDRLDGITFPSWRRQSIKALGNAIVPQIAYEIFKMIEQITISNYENN